jgi:hypothetical protein
LPAAATADESFHAPPVNRFVGASKFSYFVRDCSIQFSFVRPRVVIPA